MQTKRLDLLLLAGCSCLFTFLLPSIAHATTTPQVQQRSVTQTQIQGAFCPIQVQTKRPKIRD
jgi:hypothetical protein